MDCIVNVAVEMSQGATRMEVCVYEYEYVWKWRIRKRSRNVAIVCTMEKADQNYLGFVFFGTSLFIQQFLELFF